MVFNNYILWLRAFVSFWVTSIINFNGFCEIFNWLSRFVIPTVHTLQLSHWQWHIQQTMNQLTCVFNSEDYKDLLSGDRIALRIIGTVTLVWVDSGHFPWPHAWCWHRPGHTGPTADTTHAPLPPGHRTAPHRLPSLVAYIPLWWTSCKSLQQSFSCVSTHRVVTRELLM